MTTTDREMASLASSILRRRVLATAVKHRGGAKGGSRGWDWYYKALEAEKQTPQSPHVLHYKPLKPDHVRPRAFIDFGTTKDEGEVIGRVVVELADDVVPKTVENFTQLCTGTAPSGFSYKGNRVHTIVPNHVLATGDVTNSASGKDGHAAVDKCVVQRRPCISWIARPVSYTHLTLPTIYSV